MKDNLQYEVKGDTIIITSVKPVSDKEYEMFRQRIQRYYSPDTYRFVINKPCSN